MVGERFVRAVQRAEELDSVIDYVIAFRSAKTKVKMRLLHSPESPTSYLLIERLGAVDE